MHASTAWQRVRRRALPKKREGFEQQDRERRPTAPGKGQRRQPYPGSWAAETLQQQQQQKKRPCARECMDREGVPCGEGMRRTKVFLRMPLPVRLQGAVGRNVPSEETLHSFSNGGRDRRTGRRGRGEKKGKTAARNP
ncbi:hypothetical protein cyc_03402 [Cyclospora cayetanensis]|uniref:Uncharacterized protein n=1 Tax=Cyclospora cayetanensis TaxID=88456 RepID=A0A1D3D5J6_9EIME|nr:hypothetical protein cyc_03402 [Cyclospora cayetanensis]